MNRVSWIILFGIIVLAGCSKQEEVRVDFTPVQQFINEELEKSITLTDSLNSGIEDTERLKKIFEDARLAYKNAEPFVAIINPEVYHRVNGPPLPVFREDNGKVLPSVGFQAIEEVIYADELDANELDLKVTITLGYLKQAKSQAVNFTIIPRRFFVPMHQQLLRIYTLGLTGFDTPGSYLGLNESARLLETFKHLYSISIADTVNLVDQGLHQSFITSIDDAVTYIDKNTDFETFDRYEFGRTHLNKLTRHWSQIRQRTGLFEDQKIQAINLDAPTFFEENSFNLNFFRASYNRNPTQDQIKLGKKLFSDPKLSSNGTLSCESCHKPDLYFQDGYPRGFDKNGEELLRNTPTIINVIYQRKFFWDGRSDNLEQQITSVFDNKDEFNSDAHSIKTSNITEDSEYKTLFEVAYPGKKIDRMRIVKAISSYTSTLNAMNSRFDRNMRGELDDFTKEEILGMNLFMGKALCSTCHFIPLTNGTVPPIFAETEKEILGTPKTDENKEVDPDLGFYWVFKSEIHKYMFKTPTVRNAELTAPYMHNGVYETLEQVMDFYNKGGGAGMGFDLPHQTLPFDSLNLSNNEINAIIAFMKTFTDTRLESNESKTIASAY
jgi:cytochrome c peroxidase